MIRRVQSVTGTAKTPAPLEPAALDQKMYARGVGTVLEQTEKGGDERNEVVLVTRRR